MCHVWYKTCLTLCRFDGGVNWFNDVEVTEDVLDGRIMRSSLSMLPLGDMRGERSCRGTLPTTAFHGS